MTSTSTLCALALTLATASIVSGACSNDPITTIDRATDCSDICKMYKDCVATDYDVSACSSRCEDMDSKKQTSVIDSCENCLDGQSCVDSAFKCTAECAPIIAAN